MIVYGASGHGKVIIEILESNGITDIEVWDDADKPPMWQYPVQKPFSTPGTEDREAVISIGVNATRKKVAGLLEGKLRFVKAIHAHARVSRRATVGEGTVIMAGATINADTRIGKHCIVNTSASIDHDCVLGDYVHVSPNATLSGDVHIGEGTHFGGGAVAIQGIRIGKWCTIGAGAVVIRDIPDHATAVGNPARVIKIKDPL
ncbi:acetyltransferase [Nemorincola caseinilytica]|uniref:Acetyltransferase n=1 Tax=Nemorincola caseinilytica TaxID=2054315 RepID=A0ABP8N3S7_9BACT